MLRLVLIAVLCAGLWPMRRVAGQPAPCEALARIAPDAQLAQRIRGQTADLACGLRFTAPDTTWPADAAALDAAAALATSEGVSTILWLSDDGLQLAVYDVPTQRLWVRDLPEPSDADWAASTQDEATAIMVRGVLVTLLGERERPPPESAPPSPVTEPGSDHSAPPSAPLDVDTAHSAVDPATDEGPRGQALLWAGWALGADGLDARAHQGLRLGLGWGYDNWEARIEGHLGLRTESDDDRSALALRRRQLRLAVSPFRVPLGPLSVRAGLSAGLWQVVRETTHVQPGWDATPARTFLGMLGGAELVLRWPSRHASMVGVELLLGIDAYPNVVSLYYAANDTIELHTRAWQLQPRVAFSVFLALSP